MNKTNKIIVSIALTLVLCTGAALLAQAFFQAFNTPADGNVTITPPTNTDTDTVYVEVANEQALIAATKDATYNASGSLSFAAQRVIILLTADIKLSSPLLITRDCHIDLGGKTLDTGDYAVTVYHTYTGTFIITNGNLIGTLNVNTPNAAVLVDSSVNTADTTVLTQNVEAISPAAVCKAALSMVCAHLSNNLDHGIYGLLGYNESKCTLPDYSEYFGCEHTGCCFSVGTPDLPCWFFGYDELKITYTTASADGVDTLTASVAYGTATDSQDFIIHNISATAYENLAKAAQAILLKQLQPYKKTLEDNSEIYEFRTAILLPDTISIGSVDVPMTYTATQGSVTDNLYAPAEKGSLEIGCGPFVEDGEIYKQSIPTNGTVTELLDSVYTKANRVIKELFGAEIVIEKDRTVYIPVTWTDDHTEIPSAELYKVTDITYDLSNDTNSFYYLIKPTEGNPSWTLGVNEGKTPEEFLDKVFLQATVTIEDKGEDVEIVFNVPITCQSTATDSDTVSKFLPYYHYFNELFTQATGGNYTYHTFLMPTKFTDGSPAIEFCLVDVNNVAGGGAYAFYSFTDENDVAAINTILGTNRFITVGHPMILDENGEPVTDENDNILYDTTQWQFTIQPEYIGSADREVVFGYAYQFENEAWKDFDNDPPAQGKYTVLTVPGVVNKNDKDTQGFVDMPDDNLYAYIYSILYPGTSFNPLFDYILYSDVSKAIGKKDESKDWEYKQDDSTVINTVLDFKDSNGNQLDISSYEGLELLTGATGINLKNSGIDEAELRYVAGMTSLQYLNLASNGLTDGEDFTVNDDILEPLTALTRLEILHLENNTIYSFASLSEFPALQTAYVYDNNPEINWFNGGDNWFGQILEGIDSALTDALQSSYGSTGAVNLAEFSSICHRVDVYNTLQGSTPVKFTPELGSANDFSALANLQYQDKIPADATEATINAICEEMQTDLKAYGIAPNEHTCPVLVGNNPSEDEHELKNRIEFLYQTDTNGNEYIVLRYHNHVTIDNYKQTEHGKSMVVAVEYSIDFKYPLTRLPEEE